MMRECTTIVRAFLSIDDVSTTGATLDACAAVRKGSGVREVRAYGSPSRDVTAVKTSEATASFAPSPSTTTQP